MKKTPLTYARELHTALLGSSEATRPMIIRNFLTGLARARKTNLRARISVAFTDLALGAEGYRAGTVTTRGELDQASRAMLKKTFKNVIFEERTDPSLLGGAIVEVEDTLVDGSVRANLERLKQEIGI